MVGIDITKISRFDNWTESKIKRILHPEEIMELSQANDKSLFLATRFAIKESLFKIDNNLFHFDKINIRKENKRYVYKDFNISTSKEDDYLIAFSERTSNEN